MAERAQWLIWSEGHRAWWKPGRSGYTNSIREAGRYTLAEAREIEAKANQYLPEGEIHEVILVDLLTPQEEFCRRQRSPARRYGRTGET